MSKKYAIGIDLGSTLSEVAIFEHGKPVVIANEDGSYTTPSVIALKDGERKVGAAAKRQFVVNPKETVTIIKRFMGATYEESAEAIKHVSYEVVNTNGQPRVKVGDREYSPEELSSMILAKMKKIAEDYAGEEITDAVITVPAFFSDNARAATKKAGELAGLNVMRVINEPTAAILSSNIDMEKGGKYMVVDFGGSTEDNTVAEVGDGIVEIKSTNGDVYLGGSDIDNIVCQYIIDEFKKECGVDVSTDSAAKTRILEAAEKAKIELSNSQSTDINIPYITMIDNQPKHISMTLTKAKFEQLIEPIVNKVIKCAKDALKESGFTASELDGILLIGGSCRIPAVQEALVKNFSTKDKEIKLIKSSNMDLAVAEGAAIQANTLVGGEGSGDILLLDVTPMNYSIETLGGVATTIVEANTTVPCKKTQVFSTAADNQPAVTIKVLNGMRPMAIDNKVVGEFNLDGIPPAPKGVPQIEVTFDIDANSILTVTAKDLATNKEQHIRIESKGALSEEEINKIKADAEAHAAEDEKAKENIMHMNECESAIYSNEKMIKDFGEDTSVMTEEDKKFLEDKIKEFKKIKESGDYSNLKSVLEENQKKVFEISGKAYAKNNPNPDMMNNPDLAKQMEDIIKNGGMNGATMSNDDLSEQSV